MDRQKQLELVRERNANLSKTVQELRDKIEFDEAYNQESTKKAKSLIEELEQIKAEWTENLEELREKREQYDELIEQTRRLRALVDKEMEKRGIPRHKRRKLFRMVKREADKQAKELLEEQTI